MDLVLRAVLVGGQADRPRLDPQWHVLGDQSDIATVGDQVQRAGQCAGVVAFGTEPGREHRRVTVVQLNAQGATKLTNRYRRDRQGPMAAEGPTSTRATDQ